MSELNWREGCDDSCCAEGVESTAALRELGRYAQTWTLGDLIEKAPGEALTRREMDRRLIARAAKDQDFLEVLRSQTRFAYMVATNNAFEIPKLDFLQQIREVRLLGETERLLYLVLPFRSELQARLEVGAPGPQEGDEGTERSRIEAALVLKARTDTSFGEVLLFEPSQTYRRFAEEHCRGTIPAYLEGVREIRVIPETQDSLALVLPVLKEIVSS